MLNKNTLDVKKCEANQKQHASRQVQPIALISVEAKKLAIFSQHTQLSPVSMAAPRCHCLTDRDK